MAITIAGNLITTTNLNLPAGQYHDLIEMFNLIAGFNTSSEGEDTIFNVSTSRIRFAGRFRIIPGQRLVGAYQPTALNYWIQIDSEAEFLIDGRIHRGGDTIVKNWLAIHHIGNATFSHDRGAMHGIGGSMSSYGGNIKSDNSTVFFGDRVSTNPVRYILQDMDIEVNPDYSIRFTQNAVVQDTNLTLTGAPVLEYSKTVTPPTNFQPSSQNRIIRDIPSRGRDSSTWNDGVVFLFGSAPSASDVANEPFTIHRYPKFQAIDQSVYRYTTENKGKAIVYGLPPAVFASNSITQYTAGARQGYLQYRGEVEIVNEDTTGAAINGRAKYVFRTHNHIVSPRLNGSSTGFPDDTATTFFQGTIGDLSTNEGIVDLILATCNKYTGNEPAGLADFAPFTVDPQGHTYIGWLFTYGYKPIRLDLDFGNVLEEPLRRELQWEPVAQIMERDETVVMARTEPPASLNEMYEVVEAHIYNSPAQYVSTTNEAIIPIAVGDAGEFEIASGWTLRRNTDINPPQIVTIEIASKTINMVTADSISRGTFSSVGGAGTVHSSLESIIDAPLRRADGTVRFSVDVDLPNTSQLPVYGVFPATNDDIDRTGIATSAGDGAIFLQAETDYKLIVDAVGATRSGIVNINTGVNGIETTVSLNPITNPLGVPLVPTTVATEWAFITSMFILNDSHTEALIRLPDDF